MKTVFVLSNSWVLMGEVYFRGPRTYRIRYASVVRRWGTSNGVGEIPTKLTILDSIPGSVTIERARVLFSFDVPK